MKFLSFYLLIINLIGFIMMAYDKRQARKGNWRIPEKRLFACAALGGALGLWIGMRRFRHKTKHMTFVLGLPALFILNAVCIYGLSRLLL